MICNKKLHLFRRLLRDKVKYYDRRFVHINENNKHVTKKNNNPIKTSIEDKVTSLP